MIARIKEVGGNAAMVVGQDEQVKGAMSFGDGVVGVARDQTTRLLVVHYEDAADPK